VVIPVPVHCDQLATAVGQDLSGSGGGLEGDLIAKGFELADVVAHTVSGVDAGGVVAGAEVVELGSGVGYQVPVGCQKSARPMSCING
jgi:hypothetical protein